MGKTTVNFEAHTVLRSIQNILHLSEKNLFQADVHSHVVDLEHLDGIVERALHNFRPHTAVRTLETLKQLKCEDTEHPA